MQPRKNANKLTLSHSPKVPQTSSVAPSLLVARYVPPVELERVAFAYELDEVLHTCDGELGLVGAPHAREVRCAHHR